MLVKLTPVVNFTNIFKQLFCAKVNRAAFLYLQFWFNFWAQKYQRKSRTLNVGEIDHRRRFHQHYLSSFFERMSDFSVLKYRFNFFGRKEIGINMAIKMLVKLTTAPENKFFARKPISKFPRFDVSSCKGGDCCFVIKVSYMLLISWIEGSVIAGVSNSN
jgi:hypothetical protein